MISIVASLCFLAAVPQDRPRARDLGIAIGALQPGPLNAITDVEGVRVGHATVSEGEHIRTGVTVVLPHGDNPFVHKVPAAIVVGNGFGKLIGYTQVAELGTLESPIALTNTLNVGLVADALVGYMLELPGNERVRSVNVVVGETNDGRLNDIRGRHVREQHVRKALSTATTGAVEEGSIGAGTGTVCFGWKGGIGTSSRVVDNWTLGVLVQSNYGGRLTVDGLNVQERLKAKNKRQPEPAEDKHPDDGSCMIVVATDAPLSSRSLERLAQRALVGMARTGASFSNGSGDYVIAFSTAPELRGRRPTAAAANRVSNDRMTPLFVAVADATEEALLNSMLRATTVSSASGTATALPIDRLQELLKSERR